MTSHSRLSPGVEIHEIDRSGYQRTDYSIVGTTVLACGFADKGENYTPQWINTMQTFEQLYGQPTNEVERYLYSAAQEVVDKGGVCMVSKLPYDNDSKDRFTQTTFSVNENPIRDPDNAYLKDLITIDPSLTSFIEITSNDYSAGNIGKSRIDLDTLDRYRTSSSNVDSGKIIIVDITNREYEKINLIDRMANRTSSDVECLGLMPVMVSPVNAMFYQRIISSQTEYDIETGIEHTPGISAYQPVTDAQTRSGFKFSQIDKQNFEQDLFSRTLAAECVSKTATDYFPNITFNLSSTLDRTYLKSIGVVVFKVIMDPSNDNKINFVPVESFIGQLDKNAKNAETGASDYIGNIINSKSQYINLFSNVRIDSRYKNAQTLLIANQCAGVLGFTGAERVKHIDYKSSIIDPLNIIFNKACDPNQIRIDIVVDAGVSNIAAFAARTQDYDKKDNSINVDAYNAESYPFMPGDEHSYSQIGWRFEDAVNHISKWYAVLKKYDDFCKSVRRDCIFVADVFRPVVLEGNEKAIRGTNMRATVENTIVPRFKHLSNINSSWSAGYSNWFYAPAGQTGDFFWCPPSIKATGIYVHTDAYFHPWDAPAGLTRGVVDNVYDITFNPRNDEAGRIYQQAWNYAVSYPVEGIVVEGQKTFQLNKTALDRINVRRLMIWLEKRVTTVARRFIYEGNTAFMRQRFVDMIRPIFEEAKNGFGIIDYAIRCDDTLNTPDVIDNNELRCICAVKPVKTIEWIRLNFIITNQSANVSEETMR